MSTEKNIIFIYGINSFAYSFKKHLEKYTDQVLLYDYKSNPVKSIRKHTPDLIFANNVEPYYDKVIPFCTQLWDEPITHSIPIVIIGVDKQEEIQQGLETGAVDVIQNPMQADILALKVRNFLEFKEKSRQEDWLKLLSQAFNESDLSDDGQFLKLLTQEIIENIGSYRFCVSDLAHAVNLSERQLYRNVQSLTGYTPAGLIKEMRLQRAHKLISDRQVKTKKELANKVGYKSASHFFDVYYKRFKERPEFKFQVFNGIQ